MRDVYEVVSGQILLNRRPDFLALHSEVLLPIMRDIGITPKLLLITELGRYGRFLDIYHYKSVQEYERMTDALTNHPGIEAYYSKVGECILGSITVEIMRELPYAKDWQDA